MAGMQRPFRKPLTIRRLQHLLSSIALLVTLPAMAQSLALTFDDGLNPVTQQQAGQWNAQLLHDLDALQIQAALFPSLSRIGNAQGLALVANWATAGHMVGNHTASHRSLASPEVSLDAFTGDVQLMHHALQNLPTFTPLLRFPYLKEGNTASKRDGMRQWMHQHGYRAAPVSIDASDWYYNQIYSQQLQQGQAQQAAQVQQAYIRHLLDRARYYDQLAQTVLGRSPVHVLLLHTNQINAASLPAIVRGLRAEGWQIASASQAFADPLYREQPNTLPAGESVVWALAKAQGLPNLRYPAEDARYEAPLLRDAGLLPTTP
ncbi:MAG: polysaccharide deacetylase family protein [Comamonas sp.]